MKKIISVAPIPTIDLKVAVADWQCNPSRIIFYYPSNNQSREPSILVSKRINKGDTESGFQYMKHLIRPWDRETVYTGKSPLEACENAIKDRRELIFVDNWIELLELIRKNQGYK